MARAETIESVGETGGRGGNDPLPHHHTCCMELPRPFYSCPGLLTTTAFSSGAATVHRRNHHHNHHNHLNPLQALYPLPYSHQEDQDETRNHQRPPAFSPLPPRSPLCNRREGMGGGAAAPSAFTGEQSADLHRDECRDASSRQGPLPDLLPQNELSSRASPRQRAPGGEAAQEVEVRTVASQLRAIGDEFNATVLHRAHVAPHWQEWRDACRGLLNFITQTLSTLYRLT